MTRVLTSIPHGLQGHMGQLEASFTRGKYPCDPSNQLACLPTISLSQDATLRQVSHRAAVFRQSSRHVLPLPPVMAAAGALAEPSWKLGGGDDVELSEDEAELAEKPTRRDEGDVTKGRGRGRGRGRGARKTQSNSEMAATAGPKLEWLHQEGLDLNTERTLWRVNRAISRCSSVSEALRVVEEMKARGINVANEGTYVALITVCRRQRQGERALVVYEAMKEAGVAPGLLTVNTLLACCQQAQRLEDALRIKRDMEKVGLKPDVVTYSSLMALVVKTGPYRGRSSPAQRLAQALELFAEMRERGISPDCVTFNTLLYAAAQAKLPGKVLEIYGVMSRCHVAANQFTFQILLDSVGRGGRLTAALEVFHEMKAAGVTPVTSTYNFLLEACGTAPQPNAKKAWELFGEMGGESRPKPSAETFSLLITACCKANDHTGAMSAFEMMGEHGFSLSLSPSLSLFNKLIHSASTSEGLSSAMQMYERMREAGLSPDAVTAGTLMSACGREGDLERALEVWREMEGWGVKPNQAIYHALMGAYGRAGQWENAIQMFHEMQQNCPEEPAGLASYSLVFNACFGEEGADAFIAKVLTDETKLEITPGIKAACELYYKGVENGIFKNFSEPAIERCDVRNMTRPAMIVCVIAWLEALRERERERGKEGKIRGDIVLVTGSDKGRSINGQKKGRFPKLFACADRTFQAIGLKPASLRTLTMQALTIDKDHVKKFFHTEYSVDNEILKNEGNIESLHSVVVKEETALSEV